LEALEAEDFSKFPGEPYVMGFLRNYGGYLGLDVQELLSLYRALKIQEQAIPVEQLLQHPPRSPRGLIIFVVILAVLGLIGGGVYFYLKFPRVKSAGTVANRSAVEYTLEEDSLERRFYQGDSVLIPLDNDQYKLELAKLGETVTVNAPGGAIMLDLSQDVQLDINNDGLTDLRIVVADFERNKPSMGAQLRFEVIRSSFTGESMPIPAPAGGLSPAGEPAPPPVNTPVIFSSSNPYPFTLQVVFQGYCMFRWESDRRNRNEQYFVRTDELNIQAQDGIRVWVSNAAAIKLQVIGGGRTVPLEIGAAGEVVVADIRWVKDDDGRFRLVLTRLE
jgi:cytoskeletal protein RodZ